MQENLIEDIKTLTQTLVNQFQLAIEDENLGLVQKPLFYLSLLEEMFGIEQVFEDESYKTRFLELEEGDQIDFILAFLSEKVLGQEIEHIQGDQVVEGDLEQIQQLLQIFAFLGQEVARGAHPDVIPEEDSRFENFQTGNTRSEINREPLLDGIGHSSAFDKKAEVNLKENQNSSNKKPRTHSKSNKGSHLKVSERVDPDEVLKKSKFGQSKSGLKIRESHKETGSQINSKSDLSNTDNHRQNVSQNYENTDNNSKMNHLQEDSEYNKNKIEGFNESQTDEDSHSERLESNRNYHQISKIEQDIADYLTSKESADKSTSQMYQHQDGEYSHLPDSRNSEAIRAHSIQNFTKKAKKNKKGKKHHAKVKNQPKKIKSRRNFQHKTSDHSVEQMAYSQLQPRYGYSETTEASPHLPKKSLFNRFNYSKADSLENPEDNAPHNSELSELYNNHIYNANNNPAGISIFQPKIQLLLIK